MSEWTKGQASPEAKAALKEMVAAFEAFKAENDARLLAIEKQEATKELVRRKVESINVTLAKGEDRNG
jgi:hypothetical protein